MIPKLIISLVPSQTELLFDLGLDEEIKGLTKFCVHPADKVNGKTVIGGSKTVNFDRIHTIRPDLIIANKEENERSQIEELQHQYAVHVTDVITLTDAIAMIREVGTLVGKSPEARQMVQKIETVFSTLSPSSLPHLSVAYFIWQKPYMVAANNTFIHSMLELAGFHNAFADRTRYPEITPDDLQRAQPDLIFLSSEPYPFTEKHLTEFKDICPSARVLVVDGEMFSWYGSRLLRSSDYFKNLRTKIARHNS